MWKHSPCFLYNFVLQQLEEGKTCLLIVGKRRLWLITYMEDFDLLCFYINDNFGVFVILPKEWLRALGNFLNLALMLGKLKQNHAII